MSAPLYRIIEGLRNAERLFMPAALVRAKVVAREQEAKFILEMIGDARVRLEEIERGGNEE
jgi:hypothetical protein